MFPNSPHDLIIQAIGKKWKFLHKYVPLTKKEFLEGIKFLLNNTYIQFNKKLYKQNTGAWEVVAAHGLQISQLNCLKRIHWKN